MDSGLRFEVSDREVLIYQALSEERGDEIVISLKKADAEALLAITRAVWSVKERPQNVEGFDEFWSGYPKKTAKEEARKAWSAGKCSESLTEILSAVSTLSESSGWLKDNGKFVPYAATFLRQRRWVDVVETGSDLGVIT